MVRSNIENQESNPDFHASKRHAEVVYGGNERRMPLDVERLDSAKFEELLPIHRTLYSDGDNFRFTIIGNFDEATLRPLVERYIGSIPTDNTNKGAIHRPRCAHCKGVIEDNFNVEMLQPKLGLASSILARGSKIICANALLSY